MRQPEDTEKYLLSDISDVTLKLAVEDLIEKKAEWAAEIFEDVSSKFSFIERKIVRGRPKLEKRLKKILVEDVGSPSNDLEKIDDTEYVSELLLPPEDDSFYENLDILSSSDTETVTALVRSSMVNFPLFGSAKSLLKILIKNFKALRKCQFYTL